MTSDLFAEDRVTSRRMWMKASLAAVAWVVLYRLNGAFWDWAVFGAFGFDPDTRLGQAVHFFAYDTAKILLLLTGIIFLVAALRSFTTLERTRALLGGRAEGVGNVAAAGLGVVTPFCSCSAVPAFIGFVAAGVPLGVTMSFLIASPMVNEVAVVLMYGLFGWKIAALYIGLGLLVAIVAGFVLGRLGLEKWVEPFVYEGHLGDRSTVAIRSRRMRDMKRLLIAGGAALAGALAGSAIRQLVIQKTSSEKKELVIAANPIPVVAGAVTGVALPKRGPLAAFMVAGSVAAATKTGPEARPVADDA